LKLWRLTAKEAIDKVLSREVTVLELVSSVIDRINVVDERVKAFVTVTEDEALKRAKAIDEKIRSGKRMGRLVGIPIAVKDNICTKGLRTTCSSRMLGNYIPPYNATVINRILRNDGIIIGKTNMDEFAMGSSTENSYFGPTRNPWNLECVPGGSSGGSAVAVATGEALLALGSDTGGSIRCPASFCSVVGLKPTYGLVSRYGLVAYANSLEQIGPIAKSVFDCALLLTVVAGYDPFDSTSLPKRREDYTRYLVESLEGVKIGIPKQFFGKGTDERVAKRVWETVQKLEGLDASYEEVSIPSVDYALATYYIIAMSEASSNLARYDGVRYGFRVGEEGARWDLSFAKTRGMGFGLEVKRRIILGTFALSAGYFERYYLRALKVRTLIIRDFEKAFKKFNVLIGPTMPILPFKIGEKVMDPLSLYMCDVDTVVSNLYGGPAITVPCGFVDELPVGVQVMGGHQEEGIILRVAQAIERNYPAKGVPL
jgi:aspartyl-tRNA(Asn)/glutamyl-tRNA(Gln) amidotransferase subunit A